MEQLKAIKEQVIVIFGATSGIGRATALSCAARGAQVLVAGRNRDGLDSLVQEITAQGGTAELIVADAASFNAVQSVAARAVERFGRLDTWIHTVAISIYATFENTTPEEFKHVIDINLTGQAYGAMAALPFIKREGRGALIHVSSVEARQALPYQSAYAASKHGMKGFLDALRMELKQEKSSVSVTEIKPSGINTPFFNKARTKIGVKPMPVPPIYQPQLVADAILYAAENAVPEITVGGGGRMLELMESIAPNLTAAFVGTIGFEGQKTDVPKSPHALDNFIETLPDFDYVEGDFTAQARASSAYTWMATHPYAGKLAAGLLLGATTAWLSKMKLRRSAA